MATAELGVELEALLQGAGIAIVTTTRTVRAHYATTPIGPIFFVPGWAGPDQRRALLADLWCRWAIAEHGAAACGQLIAEMVAAVRQTCGPCAA